MLESQGDFFRNLNGYFVEILRRILSESWEGFYLNFERDSKRDFPDFREKFAWSPEQYSLVIARGNLSGFRKRFPCNPEIVLESHRGFSRNLKGNSVGIEKRILPKFREEFCRNPKDSVAVWIRNFRLSERSPTAVSMGFSWYPERWFRWNIRLGFHWNPLQDSASRFGWNPEWYSRDFLEKSLPGNLGTESKNDSWNLVWIGMQSS